MPKYNFDYWSESRIWFGLRICLQPRRGRFRFRSLANFCASFDLLYVLLCEGYSSGVVTSLPLVISLLSLWGSNDELGAAMGSIRSSYFCSWQNKCSESISYYSLCVKFVFFRSRREHFFQIAPHPIDLPNEGETIKGEKVPLLG